MLHSLTSFLASLFVGRPGSILGVALLFFSAFSLLRLTPAGRGRSTRPLLGAAMAWLAYAVWEGLVLWLTPEANIRVDLLVIWPLLVLLSGFALLAVAWPQRG